MGKILKYTFLFKGSRWKGCLGFLELTLGLDAEGATGEDVGLGFPTGFYIGLLMKGYL